jgi:hypothetical protein
MRTLFRTSLLAGVVCLFGSAALAQTKFTATVTCSKPDPQHVLDVGDRPGHTLALNQQKCVWTKPIEIGGDKYKDGTTTSLADISGGKMSARGFHVATLTSGDQATASLQFSQTLLKDGGFTTGKAPGRLRRAPASSRASRVRGRSPARRRRTAARSARSMATTDSPNRARRGPRWPAQADGSD